MTAAPLDAVLAHVDAHLDESLDRLFDLLRIPSISTEAAHRADCDRAAEWLKAELEGLGFPAQLRRAPEVPSGHAAVTVETPGAKVLFYGHYDVQPVDPLELWRQPPFEPVVATREDGAREIRARGAADDKGQLMTFIEACRAWIAVTGAPPLPISFLLEGEEEAGGASMGPLLARHGDALKAELALICDTGMWDAARPAITLSLRGLVAGTLTIRAASRDLHSGMYGGPARNPNALLAQILAELKDADGRVTLAGFYDGVPEIPADLRAIWDGLGLDAEALLGPVGLSTPAGEAGASVLEQVWGRPTAEINGMWGGYTGDGFKTVIPSEAHAKVSFRLVGQQDPAAVWAAFKAHVEERLPPDCSAEFQGGSGAPGLMLAHDAPFVAKAAAALEAEWRVAPALVGGGGSIPVVEELQRHLGMPSLLVGFGLDDDQIHAPNEKYALSSFHGGVRSWVRILAELAAPA